MSGLLLPGGQGPWFGGAVDGHDGVQLFCVLAPNASPMTLDGTNTWIIPRNGVALVVDPGPEDPSHQRAIEQQLIALEVEVAGIVLTHAHPDHAEGAQTCAQRWRVPIHDAHRNSPRSRLNCGGLEVDILPTPGHTADSACIRIAQGRLLLTGDTVLGRGTSVVAWPDGDLGDYLESLALLGEVAQDVDQLLPGHGPVLTEPSQVLAAYREHRLRRLDEVRAALAAGARTPAEVVAAVYADVPRALWPAAEQSVRAQLAYLSA